MHRYTVHKLIENNKIKGYYVLDALANSARTYTIADAVSTLGSLPGFGTRKHRNGTTYLVVSESVGGFGDDIPYAKQHNPATQDKLRRDILAGKREIDKALLLAILNQINDELYHAGLHATFNTYGGCAMMLTCYDTKRSWDIDGIFTGITPQQAYDIVNKVVTLNNVTRSIFDYSIATALYAHLTQNDMLEYENLSNLKILVCQPRQLLAMKIFSARLQEEYKDLEDAVALCRALGIKTAEEIENTLYAYIKRESVIKQERNPDRPNSISTFIAELVKELAE